MSELMYGPLKEIAENNFEYQILPYQFFLLTLWGIWSPKNCSEQMKDGFKVWFMVVYFLDTLLLIEMFIFFVTSFGTDKFKLINFFLLTANMTAVYKAIKLRKNREVLRSFVLYNFSDQWIDFEDSKECEIYSLVNLKIKQVTVIYSVSMLGIVLLKAVSTLLESSDTALPVDAWYPYSINNQKLFWVTYVHQVILGSSAVSAHIGIDTLFVGLLLKTSCHIDILKHRLENLKRTGLKISQTHENQYFLKSEEQLMIVNYVKNHQRIYRLGKDLNKLFQEMLVILVVSSIPNICINIFSLSAYRDKIDLEYISIFLCTTSALIQFFIVCWFGNEVMLNSVEVGKALWNTEWINFNTSTQKLFSLIIMRSIKPIRFTAGHIMYMNLESFIRIIKTSYTAFNLLQRTVHY